MEKLSQQQQKTVQKRFTDRLRLKLMASVYEEEMILGLDRANLIGTYAELLAAGKISPMPAPLF